MIQARTKVKPTPTDVPLPPPFLSAQQRITSLLWPTSFLKFPVIQYLLARWREKNALFRPSAVLWSHVHVVIVVIVVMVGPPRLELPLFLAGYHDALGRFGLYAESALRCHTLPITHQHELTFYFVKLSFEPVETTILLQLKTSSCSKCAQVTSPLCLFVRFVERNMG